MSTLDSPRQPRPAMDPGRRGSWWRRVTSKMKRKSDALASPRPTPTLPEASSSATAPGLSTAVRAVTPTKTPAQEIMTAPGDAGSLETATIRSLPAASLPFALEVDPVIAADSEEEVWEESLLPSLPIRTGFSSDRTRELFAKYGVQNGTRGTQALSGPPNKIRRVEKAVRLRVHWTCHECNRLFGTEKTCHGCGHRRCGECTRHPPRRRPAVTEPPSQEMEHEEEMVTAVGSHTVDEDLLRYQQEPSAPVTHQQQSFPTENDSHPNGEPRTLASPVTGTSIGMPLELDSNAEDDEDELPNIDLSAAWSRPRAGVIAMLKPKSQIVRRTCHKCQTQLVPPSRNLCLSCGHERCEQCPRVSISTIKKSLPGTSGPPTADVTERVFRKPRQRVRITCERCNTHFVDSNICTECGHTRCGNCTREPPRRPRSRQGPVINEDEAVADILQTHDGDQHLATISAVTD